LQINLSSPHIGSAYSVALRTSTRSATENLRDLSVEVLEAGGHRERRRESPWSLLPVRFAQGRRDHWSHRRESGGSVVPG